MRTVDNNLLDSIVESLSGKLEYNSFTLKGDYNGYRELETIIRLAMPGYYIFVYDCTDTSEIAHTLVKWGDTTDIQFATVSAEDHHGFESPMPLFVIAIKP